jgi:hypothetical protein
MKRMNHFIYPNEEGPQRKKWLKKGPLLSLGGERRGRRKKGTRMYLFPSVQKKTVRFFFVPEATCFFLWGLFYFKLINISITTICDLFRGCLLFSDLFRGTFFPPEGKRERECTGGKSR